MHKYEGITILREAIDYPNPLPLESTEEIMPTNALTGDDERHTVTGKYSEASTEEYSEKDKERLQELLATQSLEVEHTALLRKFLPRRPRFINVPKVAPINKARTNARGKISAVLGPLVSGLALVGLAASYITFYKTNNPGQIDDNAATASITNISDKVPDTNPTIINTKFKKFEKLEPGDTFYEYLCDKAGKKVDRETPQSMSAIMAVASDYLELQGKTFAEYIDLDALNYFRAHKSTVFAKIIAQIKSKGIPTPESNEIANYDFSQTGQNFEEFRNHISMYFVNLDKSSELYETLYRAKEYLHGNADIKAFDPTTEESENTITINSQQGANINLQNLEQAQELQADNNLYQYSNYNPLQQNYEDQPELLTDVVSELDDGEINARDFFEVDKFDIPDELNKKNPTIKTVFTLASTLRETREKGTLLGGVTNAIGGFFKKFGKKKI
ncbi:MAG: hypothetical protein WC755_08385, partial [Candidatus Woesearchaeota archaeon]|jgi:hypothetical protein